MATVFLGNTIFRGALNALRPCMDNLIFEGDVVVGGLYLNKLKSTYKLPTENYLIGNYTGGTIHLIDKNYNIVSPIIDVKEELNKNGMFFYSPKVGVRDVCIDLEGFYWVLDWVYHNIYRFDKNLSYTGNYIDLDAPIDVENREIAPEGCYVKNNGNIVVVGRTLEAIIEFSFTASESWQVDIGTFVSKTSYPAELADTTIKAIYQDRETGEWVLIDNKYFNAHKLTPNYGFISTHFMKFFEEDLSYDNYYGITKTPQGNWLTTEINRDRIILFDSDFNVISNAPSPFDDVVSGITLTYNISIDDINPYDDAKLINSNCLRFNGIDNLVNCGNNSKYNMINGLFLKTIIKFPSFASNQRIISKETSNIGWSIGTSGNSISLYINGITYKLLGFVLETNRYYTIEIEHNSSNGMLKIWVDNNLQQETIYNTGEYTINSLNMSIGARPNSTVLSQCDIAFFELRNNRDSESLLIIDNAEGDGDKVYNRVDGVDYQIQGTLTDVWSTKQNTIHNNIKNGFDLWKNDLTDELLRVPYNVNNQSIKGENDIITGYTWQSTHPANSKIHNYAETQIDFTNDGANADIPILLNAWHPDNLSGLEGSQLFYKKDANKNTKNHLVYSQELTGACLNKTKKYTKWK